MAEGSVITDEMRAAIGKKSKPITHTIEEGAIRRFAQAIGDPNPLWSNEAEARKSRYGGVVAPPTFTCTLMSGPLPVSLNLPYSRRLNGGEEWEYFEPIRPGDRITVVNEIADIYERPGRMGNMLFIVTRRTFTNQFGQKVAVYQNTGISY